jgi:hypothetical protein
MEQTKIISEGWAHGFARTEIKAGKKIIARINPEFDRHGKFLEPYVNDINGNTHIVKFGDTVTINKKGMVTSINGEKIKSVS